MENEEILQKVYELVSEIKETQSEIKSDLAAHAAAQQTLCANRGDCLNKLSEKVLGNGKPGALSDIAALQKEFGFAKWIIAAVILPVAGYFGAMTYDKINTIETQKPPNPPKSEPAKTVVFGSFANALDIQKPKNELWQIDKQGKITKQ